MSNFTIDNRVVVFALRHSRKLQTVFVAGLISFILTGLAGAQSHNDGNKDQTLRGRGRVNESTLGLELNINLGNYPGRGIDIPVSLNYSSKVWRAEFMDNLPRANGTGCISGHEIVFSEHSSSGWTSSLTIPYLEYTGVNNLFTPRGYALSDGCLNGNQGGDNRAAFIKRITAYLPEGQSHELRSSDEVTVYNRDSTPPFDFNGTFFSPDSSNVKYVENANGGVYKLMLPDGSFYTFASQLEPLSLQDPRLVRKAIEYRDVNGNRIVYSSENDGLTDTLGRVLESPFQEGPPSEPTTTGSPQVYSLPGLAGSSITFKLHWKHLNGGSQADSAMTDISDPAYQLKFMADRSSANPYGTPRASGTFLFGSNWENWVHDSGAGIFNPVVLTKIELPEGTSYSFSYDNHGRIEKIVYPKGAVETVGYEKVPTLSKSEPGSPSLETNFGVATRRLYPDPASQEKYSWSYIADGSAPLVYKVSVISPDGIRREKFMFRGERESTSTSFGDFGFQRALTGKIFERRTFDRGGSLIARNITRWAVSELSIPGMSGYPYPIEWHPRVKYSEKYVYNASSGLGIKAARTFEYEAESELDQIGQVVLEKSAFTYDYAPAGNSSAVPGLNMGTATAPTDTEPDTGDLIKHYNSTYLINDESIPVATRDIHKAKNLIALPTVTRNHNGAGVLVSQIEFSYDQAGFSPATGLGNLTETRTWDSSRGGATESEAYNSVKSEFDQYGNPIAVTDAMGNRSTTEFDTEDHTFPIRATGPAPDPDGETGSATPFDLAYEHDPNTGLLLSKTDANGIETRTEYDPATLRVMSVRKFVSNTEVGAASEILYGDTPNAAWVRTRKQIDDTNWKESTAYLDGLGRILRSETSDAGGNVFIEREFDSDGRAKRISAPFRQGETKRWTANQYDDQGRIIRITSPDGSSITTDFGILVSDRRGTTKTVTDQAGRRRTGVTDAAGRMFRIVEDPDGAAYRTDYVFDSQGRIRETIQGVQHRYFNFDSLGRLRYSKQPEQEANVNFVQVDDVTGNNQWSLRFEHDKNGNIIRNTDARNTVLTTEYDQINRAVKRSFSDGTPEVTLYYDGTGVPNYPARAKGSVTRIRSEVSDIKYLAFDSMGRVLEFEQTTGNRSFRTLNEYNRSGQLIAETYPSGRRMEFDLNRDGSLIKVSGRKQHNLLPTAYLTSIKRNSNGEIERQRLGNGRWETIAYNSRDQIKEVGLGHSENDKSILNIGLDYAAEANNGAVIGQTISYSELDQPINQDYQYDALNRLRTVSESVQNSDFWSESYQYDRYGNRELDPAATSTVASFNMVSNPAIDSSSNRLTVNQDGDSIQDFTYDRAGNLLKDSENKRYEYNGENRIKAYFRPSNSGSIPDAKYEYDGQGRRVRKTADGVEIVFVYSSQGKLIAEYSDKLPESPQMRYLTQDHLGSTRVVTDGAGSVVSRNDFLAFGESVNEKLGNVSGRDESHGYGPEDDVRNQYTGYERDKESGLDFAQNRYYSPHQGRYTSVDPLNASADLRNPQSFNRYSYGMNSPYKFVDPLGLLASPANNCGENCEDGDDSDDESSGADSSALWLYYASLYEAIARANAANNDPVADATVREQGFYWFTSKKNANGEPVETTVAIGTVALSDEMLKMLGDDATQFQNTGEQLSASMDTINKAVSQLREAGFGYSIHGGADGKVTLRTTSPLGAKSIAAPGGIGIEMSQPTVTSNAGKLVEDHNAQVQKRNEMFTERKTAFQNKFAGTEMNITSFQSTSISGTVRKRDVDTKMTRTNLGALYNQRIGRLAGRDSNQ